MNTPADDFCGFLSREVAEVTDEQVFDLQAGQPCPPGGTLTGFYLLEQEKAILVTFAKFKAEYLLARNQFARLNPGDQKVIPLAELSRRYNECRLTLDLFWASVRSRLMNQVTYFREIGFDQNFQLWYGSAIRRDLGDFSISFDESCIRL
jgi:hypothetical protein